MKIKSDYFKDILGQLKNDINARLKKHPQFREEFFDKLYTFFQRYFSETGSIYFKYTPLNQKVYEQVYTEDKDVVLFWKTHMLYYVKSEKRFENLDIKIDNFNFHFDVSELERKKANEKLNIIYILEKIDSQKKHLKFKAKSGRSNQKTKFDKIKKELEKENIEINQNLLEKVFNTFEKQSKVDYFINKNAKRFLKEQFNLWFYQYIFKGESQWNKERLEQLNILKKTAFDIINFISQFENELVKVWNKPKFVLDSNYVITLNKIQEKNLKLLKKILSHDNFPEQIKEWERDEIIKKKVKRDDLIEKNSEHIELKKKFQFLPIDTIYFKDLELEIIGLFEDLDESLDGLLIKSENYQAMDTILPKFKEKIQTVYWDPPFNTGQEFAYLDRFQDSTWLTLIENRLNINKKFLNQKGSIFVHLDDNADYLGRKLMNKIFQKENFRAEISNFLGYNMKREINPKKFIEQTEIILHYSKTDRFLFNKIAKVKDRYLVGLKGKKKQRFENKYLEFFKTLLKDPKYINFFDDGLFQAYSPNLIAIKDKIKSNNRTKTIIKDIKIPLWEKGEFILKSIFKQVEIDDLWNEKYFINMVGNTWMDVFSFRYSAINFRENEGFQTQKPEKLLARIILSTSNTGQRIMDPFLGSATTTAVAQKLNRKWIGIEMDEDIFDKIALPRMKKVIAGDQGGISDMVKWRGGGFFKYFELEQYEDTLKKMKYKDSKFFQMPDKNPYNQYIFMKDEKFLSTLDLDYENDKIKLNFSTIFNNIDISETISNLLGKSIKKVKKESVIFNDNEEIYFEDLDFKRIKNLIWW